MSATKFSLLDYLRDRIPLIMLWLACMILITIMLVVLLIPFDAIVLIAIIMAIVLVLAIYLDYHRRADFWKSLAHIAETLERAEYLEDLIDSPLFIEGQIAHDSACMISRRASQEIAELRARNREHAEYTELWVHEVKTPLAAAKLTLDKMHGPDADTLKHELERLEGMVEQALFAARSESLASDYLIREISLIEAVREACRSNMRYLTSCKVALDMHIEPDVTVLADKTWLAFILSQLITNAAKYEANTITFTAILPDREGPNACTPLEVRDDGCGIPAADVPRVFDRGFTGEVGRAHGSATGMGLYLVARMCKRMGLGVMIASEEGVGTRVMLSFPHDRRRAQANLTVS